MSEFQSFAEEAKIINNSTDEKKSPEFVTRSSNQLKDMLSPNESQSSADRSPIIKTSHSPTIKSIKRSKINLCAQGLNARKSSITSNSNSSIVLKKTSQVLNQSSSTPTNTSTRPKTKFGMAKKSTTISILGKKIIASSTVSLAMSEINPFKSSEKNLRSYRPAILIPSKDKEKRGENDKKYPWPINEARSEYIDNLKKSLKFSLNPNLYECMFATGNFKKHIECVSAIQAELESELTEIISVLDLLLKWTALRLLDNNPGLNKCIIEFYTSLIECLIQSCYVLTESESSILIQLLSDRLSNSNTYIKEQSKKLLILSFNLTSPNKIAIILIKTLKNKNTKARLECIELLKYMIKEQKSISFIPEKEINYFASLLSVKDNSLKALTLSFLIDAYHIDGMQFWNKIGKIDKNAFNELSTKLKTAESNDLRSSFLDTVVPQDIAPIPFVTKEENKNELTSNASNKGSPSYIDFNSFYTSNENNKYIQHSHKTSNVKILSPITEAESDVCRITKQLQENSSININDLSLQIGEVIKKESDTSKIETLLNAYSNHCMIKHVTDARAMGLIIHEIMGRIQANDMQSSNIFQDLQNLISIGDTTTIYISLIAISPKLGPKETLILSECLSTIEKRVCEVDLAKLFRAISDVMSNNIISSELSIIIQKLIQECVVHKGFEIWDFAKDSDLNEQMMQLIDDAVFNENPEFSNIIKNMKTTGVKGVASKLKEFSGNHPEFNFDKVFARCSKLLMQQIKEEIAIEKVESIEQPNSPPMSLKDSINKLREKYSSKVKASSPTLPLQQNIESRFKDLSEEIQKMKQSGIL